MVAVKWREAGSAAACLRTVLQTKRKSVSMADKGDGAPPPDSRLWESLRLF